jgi:hypothetical protein
MCAMLGAAAFDSKAHEMTGPVGLSQTAQMPAKAITSALGL